MADDWLTEGGSSSRSNSVDERLALPLELDWEYNAGAGFGPGGPLVTSGYVFVSTRKGEVVALSVERGKKVGADSFGESVDGSPSIKDEIIYVPTAWGSSKGVIAHNLRTGTSLWKYACPPVDEGVLLTERLVIFSDIESTVHAVDLRTGIADWRASLDPSSAVTTTPVLAGNVTVVVADDRGVIYALDSETGRRRWTAKSPGPVYSTPAATSDVVVVGSARGTITALNPETGESRWQWSAADAAVKMASPAIRGDAVIIGSSDGLLRAFDLATGNLEWTWHGDSVIASAPVIADGQVFFGTMGKRAYVLDASTGHELWSTEVRGRIKSSPTVNRGAAYFLSESRYLYRFIPATTTDQEVHLSEN